MSTEIKIPADYQELMNLLGLTDAQAKVYFTLLKLGWGTLGQIYLLSGVNPLDSQETLRELIEQGFVERISGPTGRYLPLIPFLKALIVTQDTLTLSALTQQFFEMFDEKVHDINEFVKTKGQQVEQSLQEQVTDLLSVLEAINTSKDVLKEQIQRVSSQANVIISTEKELESFVEQHYKNTAELIRQKMKELLSNQEKEAVNSLSRFKKSIEAKISAPTAEYENTFYTKIENPLITTLNALSDEITKTLDSLRNEYSDKYDAVKNTTKQELQEKTSKLDVFKQELEAMSRRVESNEAKFDDVAQSVEQLQTKHNATKKNLDSMVEQLNAKLNTLEAEIETKKLFRGKKEILSLIQETKALLHHEHTTLTSKMQETTVAIQNTTTKLNEIKETFITSPQYYITSFFEIIKGLEIIKNQLMDNLDQIFRDEIVTQFSHLKERIMSKTSDLMSAQRQSLQSQKHELLSFLESATEQLNKLSQDMFEEIQAYLISTFALMGDKSVENLDSAVNSSFKTFLTEREKHLTTLEQYINEVKSTAESIILTLDDYSLGYKEFIDGSKTTLTQITIDTFKNINNLISNEFLSYKSQFNEKISAILYSLTQTKQNVTKIIELTKNFPPRKDLLEKLDTDVLVGEISIVLMLKDLIQRTKRSITIIMPRPEIQALKLARQLPYQVRVTIISNFNSADKTELQKIIQDRSIRLRHIDEPPLWAAIKDVEECMFAPPELQEKMIGIYSFNEKIVQFLQEYTQPFIHRAKDFL